MANRLDNLRPFGMMSPEQHKAISSKGGKASGAARRAKRDRIRAEEAKIIAERTMEDEIPRILLKQTKILALYAKSMRRYRYR